jgi:excisionase family DNA binding protein
MSFEKIIFGVGMETSYEIVRADNRRMKRFICERIADDGETIVLADGEGGPAWVDLFPIRDDDSDCDLLLETNEPDWIDLRAVYDYFRRREMTWAEWFRMIEGETDRIRVHSLQCEIGRLRTKVANLSLLSTEAPKPTSSKSTLTVSETAALLGCSYGEARKRMLEGRIQAVKDGRWLRTRPEWVEEYVAKNRIKPAETAGATHAIPLPTPRRKTHAKVKMGGIGYHFLKNRAK